MIIQIIGQAGSGKTSLAIELADRINAIHINADEVRLGNRYQGCYLLHT
jgi:predicted kinase